jgi:hypothetical protein
MRHWLRGLGLAALGWAGVAQAQVAPADMEKRIASQASQLQEKASQADRAAFVDFTWPADAAEYRSLAKHVLVLVTAVSRDDKELPVKRVYIEAGGKAIELRRLGGDRTEIAADSAVAKVLGAHREDSFWLAPASAMARKGHLRLDFAANREGFGVYELPGDPPDFIARDPKPLPARTAKPDLKAVRAMLEREYPGFPVPHELL